MEHDREPGNAKRAIHEASHEASYELVDSDPATQVPSSDDDAAHPEPESEPIPSDLESHPSTEVNVARLTTYLGDTRDRLKAAGSFDEQHIRKILQSLATSASSNESVVSGTRSDPSSSRPTSSSSPRVDPHLRRNSKSSLIHPRAKSPTNPSASPDQSSSSRKNLSIKAPRGQSFALHTDHLEIPGVPQSRRIASVATKVGIKDAFFNQAQQTTQTPYPTSPTSSDSPLLDLPPELRNRIYRFALIEPRTVHIHRSHWSIHQPALLKTCKQIRHEALRLFYLENKICTEIRDWGPAVRTRVKQLLAANGIEIPPLHHCYKGDPNWSNLLAWLQASYEGRLVGISECRGKERALDRKLIGFLFTLVRTSKRKLPWSAVKNLLEAQCEMLGMLDEKWLR